MRRGAYNGLTKQIASMYRYITTNEFKEHHIYMQIESKDKSKWGSFEENEYIQNHLLGSPDIVERLEQMMVEDDVLYEIGDIPDPPPEAFDYPDNKSSGSDNDIKLMPSNSKDKA